MLPDFPKLKSQLMKSVQGAMRRSVYQQSALLSEVRHFKVHEGDSTSVVHSDGSVDTSEYRLTEVKFEIPTAEIPTLTPQKLAQKLLSASEEMAGKVSEYALGKLREATEQAGTVIDAGGRPLSPELLFETLERMELDFYEDGTPHELTMLVGPDLARRLEVLIPQWRADPTVDDRYQAILRKKREEWRVREASRKLVE